MLALLPEEEPFRLDELRSLEVLDTDQDPELQSIAQIAAHTLNVPIALVSLVDANRQWFKAKIGLDATETHRDYAFCAHAILQSEPLVIEDALSDSRFADNPLVTGEPGIRFYAGAPLVTRNGYRIGTLCTIGLEPRTISENELKTLQLLASLAVDSIQREKQRRETQAVIEQHESQADGPALNLSNLAHELRTPLRHIISFSNLIQGELTDNGQDLRHKGYLDIIRQSGQHLNRLIENVMRFEKASLKDSLKIGPQNTTKIISEITNSFSNTLSVKQQTVVFRNPDDTITALADATSLRQIMINLLSNASKHCPDGTNIFVDISPADGHQKMSIRIQDNGPGVPDSVLTALGKPFLRGLTTKEAGTEGHGLGLYISKRLCAAMDGELKLERLFAGGTCATVTIPVSESA
jgi:signal transduction histidine kinase